MAAYRVRHLDAIEEHTDAGSHYRAIRVELGISAFGVTAWTGHAGDLLINEHDPGDPTCDEELFLVLRGHAAFNIDGDRVDAPSGVLVSAPPGTRRSAVAVVDDRMILLVEGTPGAAYDARGWELWAPLAPDYFAGKHAMVADRLRAIVAEHPQYPMLVFNLACCESFLGRTRDAIAHLREAIAMSEEFRQSAREDGDLDGLRGELEFQELIKVPGGGPPR
jgi:mannose-6-phosphate isomerase-like protein (cupin superfamily)